MTKRKNRQIHSHRDFNVYVLVTDITNRPENQ